MRATIAREIDGRSLANIDEVYAPFTDLGLLQEESRRRQSAGSAAVNSHAGTFNRFLQFGESARATKTAGSYGGGRVNPVSFGLGGNMHPAAAVPMEQVPGWCPIVVQRAEGGERCILKSTAKVSIHPNKHRTNKIATSLQ